MKQRAKLSLPWTVRGMPVAHCPCWQNPKKSAWLESGLRSSEEHMWRKLFNWGRKHILMVLSNLQFGPTQEGKYVCADWSMTSYRDGFPFSAKKPSDFNLWLNPGSHRAAVWFLNQAGIASRYQKKSETSGMWLSSTSQRATLVSPFSLQAPYHHRHPLLAGQWWRQTEIPGPQWSKSPEVKHHS